MPGFLNAARQRPLIELTNNQLTVLGRRHPTQLGF
jgi:hypothetical protein